MFDSTDFIGKHVEVTTTNDNEVTATLISIEEKGLILEDEGEDSNGDTYKIYYFIPHRRVQLVKYDKEGY